DASLELSDNFTIELDAWVDTTSDANKNIVYKQDAFKTYVAADTNITSEIIQSTTVTFYPDPNVESSSVDGWARDTGNSVVWATLVAKPGNDADDSDASEYIVWIQSKSTTDKWDDLRRGIYLFDTNSIPDDVTIVSATFSVRGSAKGDNFSPAIAPNINVYSSNPASNTSSVAGDFNSLGSTAFCDTPITYASWSTTGYNNFALNSSGLAAIDKTGVTKLGLRNANYDVTGNSPTWSASGAAYLSGYFADQA
ncbi:unnamed protein product, partial [marine sediment metagenome]